MPERHAVLGPSSAHRWAECPPSVRLCEQFPEVSSPYAQEGTIAHGLCELWLRKLNDQADQDCIDEYIATNNCDKEMQDSAIAYRDFVEEELNTARAQTKDAQLFIEQELDFSEYVPEGFGTSDSVIISDTTLQVIDFKYGKGVAVDCNNNAQLMLYALGAYIALGSLYDFTNIKMSIFQPRIYNISSAEMTVTELLDWAENYIKPRALLAYKGEGEFKVGEHCRFCKASGVCRARAEEAFKVIDRADEKPELISDDEIPDILDKLDNAEKWIEAIRNYASEKAIKQGVHWRGYKIVEGRTVRKITDQLRALTILNEAGYSSEEVTTVKLKGLTDLEKIMGKANFQELLGSLVVKPQGEPTLVKETDKRPEFNPIYDAFKED